MTSVCQETWGARGTQPPGSSVGASTPLSSAGLRRRQPLPVVPAGAPEAPALKPEAEPPGAGRRRRRRPLCTLRASTRRPPPTQGARDPRSRAARPLPAEPLTWDGLVAGGRGRQQEDTPEQPRRAPASHPSSSADAGRTGSPPPPQPRNSETPSPVGSGRKPPSRGPLIGACAHASREPDKFQ